MKRPPIETLLWSVALPGFGQLLNQQYVKGILLIVLEFVINIGSNLNQIIIYSFQGDIAKAISHTNYQWLLFYPCIYMFGIWDSFRDAGGGTSPLATLPFVLSGFFGTVGIIFSDRLQVGSVMLGPVWLPMLFAFAGIGIGLIFKTFVRKIMEIKP